MGFPQTHEIIMEGSFDAPPIQHRSAWVVCPTTGVITNHTVGAKNRCQIKGDVALVGDESTKFAWAKAKGVWVHRGSWMVQTLFIFVMWGGEEYKGKTRGGVKKELKNTHPGRLGQSLWCSRPNKTTSQKLDNSEPKKIVASGL